ncbi:MAG: hypothetical protein U0793_20055 [Gemmataceae bacterium]
MARRLRCRKKETPLMLFWSRTEQRRFIDAVERLVTTVGDLETVLARKKRERRTGPSLTPTEAGANRR